MFDVFGYIDPSSGYIEPAACRIVATRLVYLGSAMATVQSRSRWSPEHINDSSVIHFAVASALVAAHK